MNPTIPSASDQALTRVELLAVLAALALLVALVLPALAGTRRGTDLATCLNNLRQIGRAYQVWGHDHNDDRPTRTSVAQGGVMGHALAGNAWFQFSWISNELATPRVLACPSDFQKKTAKDFSLTSDGGFLNAGYRNNALSYWIGSDATRFIPRSFLCGDRNVRLDGFGGCSIGVNNVGQISTRPLRGPFWTGNLHELWGNILSYDGEVRTFSNPSMVGAASRGDDNGSMHLIMP